MKSIIFFSSENSKRVIVVVLIVVLGTLMAARKQFVFHYEEIGFSYEWSVIEGHEKELGHLHPLFRKDAFEPPSLSIIPYSLHYSKNFHVISAVLYWILVIALVFLIIRQVGFDYYFSIVVTMFVLFVGNLVIRAVFNIPLIGPAPYIGYPHFDYRIFVIPLFLASVLSIFRGRLILSGLLLGLVTVIHIKFGFRMFAFLIGCMVLWNLWGYRKAKVPELKIPFKSITGFSFCWFVQFTAILIYILNTVSLFDKIETPRVATPFLSRLGWIIKNEQDDWLISYNFHSDVTFFGFLLLAVATIIFCILIRRITQDTKLKIMTVILTLSVFIALLFFGYGFLFENFLIDYLPLSWSTSFMLTRGWDLLWVVIIAPTIVIFFYVMLWTKNLGQKFKESPFIIQKLFLHLAFVGFVLFNLYIFINKKDSSIFREKPPNELPHLNLSYIQICTEDTALYKKTVDRLWELTIEQNDARFDKQLYLLENIFDRTLKPEDFEKINNPDVKTLRTLYHLKSNRYRHASQELQEVDVAHKEKYFWSCDNKGPGLHHMHVEIPFQDFYDVSQWIKKNTPVDRGVINPPYIPRMGMYSKRVIFYEFKRDSHIMYQLKSYYPIGLARLKALAGPYGVIMAPGIRGGQIGLRGRAYFLSLRQEGLRKIRESYPHYDYLVTENQALSGFRMLYSNASFAVYDISKNRPLEPQFKNIPRDKPS